MRVLIDGQQGGLVDYNVGSDQTFQLLFLDDDGAPLDYSSDTATVEVYQTSSRSNTLATKAVSGGTPASGTGTVVISDTETNWVDLNAGTVYTFRGKIVEAGGDVLLSRNTLRLNVI